MYDSHLITDHDCRNMYSHGVNYGYSVDITINYYRGLPISCIDEIALEVDGEAIDPKDMVVRTRGKEFAYNFILSDECPTDLYWLHGDYLKVIVLKDGGIPQGIHHVKLTLKTRRSYTPTMVSVCEKDITIA